MDIKALLGLVSVLIVACGSAVGAQQNDALYDEDVSIVRVTPFSYPPVPMSARIQGVVVVTGVLDDRGNVTEATALSGHKVLTSYAVASVKTWAFKPNAQHRFLVVLDFLLDGGCHRPGDTQIRVRANVVRLTSCGPVNF
jgi:TonB family protein